MAFMLDVAKRRVFVMFPCKRTILPNTLYFFASRIGIIKQNVFLLRRFINSSSTGRF
jgi:hypothetical protein